MDNEESFKTAVASGVSAVVVDLFYKMQSGWTIGPGTDSAIGLFHACSPELPLKQFSDITMPNLLGFIKYHECAPERSLTEEEARRKVQQIRREGGDAIALPAEAMKSERRLTGWQVVVTELPPSHK